VEIAPIEIGIETQPKPVTVSDSAAAKVKQLIAEENNENLMLRVYVTGGGCSGFQYGFDFDQEVKAGDMQIEKDGITVLVDTMSAQYLAGAEIDYKDDLEGARFLINNPNAASTCGCGASFSI
jgi:iron-sulfur cluster insertion protein